MLKVLSMVVVVVGALPEYCGRMDDVSALVVLEAVEGMELVQVQVVTRHGARTPAAPCQDYLPVAGKLKWNECTPESRFVETMEKSFLSFARTFESGSTSLGGSCACGQLIDAGVHQMRSLGGALRQAYASGPESTVQHVFPLTEKKKIYARTSDLSRTRASAEALLSGLLELSDEPIILETTDFSEDWIYPNEAKCPELTLAKRNAYEADLEFFQWNATARNALDDRFRTLFPDGYTFGDDMAGSHLLDCVLSAVCVGKGDRLYDSSEQDFQSLLKDFTAYAEALEYQKLRFDNAKYSMLAAAPLLRRVLEKASSRDRDHFVVWSGHDTTVMPFKVALGIDDHTKWAPYADAVVLEIWQQNNSSKFLRVITSTGPQTLIGCHGPLCPLDQILQTTNTWMHDDASCRTEVPLLQEELPPWRLRRAIHHETPTRTTFVVLVASLALTIQFAMGFAVGRHFTST